MASLFPPPPSLVIWYGRPNQMSSNFGPHALVLGISAVVLVNNSNTDDGRFVDPCPTESRRICRTSLQEPTLHSWPSTERFWWTSTRSRSFSRNDWSHHGTFYRFTCHYLRSLIHSLKKFLKINPGTFFKIPKVGSKASRIQHSRNRCICQVFCLHQEPS